MPTSTTNYELIKPGTDDPILVGQLNDNMDTIDTVLKDHSDKIDAAALGIKYKGEVNYYSNLPNDAEIGDAYTVKYAGSSGTTPDGTEYVWGAVSGVNQWINFSKDSYSKAEVDALLALKQNALSSTQLAAVNSGINSTKVAQISTNQTNISKVQAQANWNTNNGVKNLSPWSGGTASTDNTFVIQDEPITLPAGTYLISYLTTATSGRAEVSFRNDSTSVGSITLNNQSGRVSGTVILTSTSTNFRVYTMKACTISEFMVSPTTMDTTYQPYAKSNSDLTTLSAEDRASLVELVDGGAKNDLEFDAIGTTTTYGTTYESNGMKFTLNADNTVTFERISTSSSAANCLLILNGARLDVSSYCDGNHILSGCPSGGSSNTYEIMATVSGGVYTKRDYGTGVILDSASGIEPYIQLTVRSGFTGTATFKPMICTKAAWDISQTYQPYRSSYQELYEKVETNKTNISNKNWNFRKIRYIATSAETWEKVKSLYITIPPLKKAFITISAKYNNFEVTGVALSISDTFKYTNCIACEEPTNALNAVTASAVFENLANANATIVPYIKLSNSGGGGDDVWISYRLLDD